MSRSSNYQIYLDEIINFSSALRKKHIKLVKDGARQEIYSSFPGSICGLEHLSWDSKILNLHVGAVTDFFCKRPLATKEADALVNVLEREIEISGLSLVNLRISAKEHVLLQAFITHGWCVVDSLNIYFAKLTSTLKFDLESLQDTFSLTDFNLPEGLDFMKSQPGLFNHARMYNDNNISNLQADRFYQEVFCSQYTSPSSIRIGLRSKGDLIGLAIGNHDQWLSETCNFRLGYLWLIGLSEEHRGKKLSRPLLAAFLHKASDHIDYLEIGTQEENINANKLYRSAGFKQVAKAITMHRWLQ